MDLSHLFHGPNAGYIEDLFERYSSDPSSVDEATRALFSAWSPTAASIRLNGTHANGIAPAATPNMASTADASKVVGIANLANAIRRNGHLAAQLDPLGTPPPGDPNLGLDFHGLTDADLAGTPGDLFGGTSAETAAEVIARLRTTYSSSIGIEFDHLPIPEERRWLRDAVETRRFHPDTEQLDRVAVLKRLSEVEGFEQFLHNTFQGKKRFSIEGLDVMVPMLDEMLLSASQQDVQNILIGMAHRGRLSVLTHVMQKPAVEILAEFKDNYALNDDQNYTGDVKYHFGYKRAINGKYNLMVEMADNPSHLELVNPVVEGMARAAVSKTDQAGMVSFDPHAVVPIVIHGDAAFAGQGIVAETLNLARIPGWRTGGTIHIIANNQVGFTADWFESRGTLYASDVAKGYEIPVFHVNADDVDACIEVARLAMAYQEEFEKDFVIDLIGYRRYGHNEGDEPRFTQPVMYQRVDDHPTVRALYADKLTGSGMISAESAAVMLQTRLDQLQVVYDAMDKSPAVLPKFEPDTHEYRKWETGVSAETLRAFNQELLTLPESFELHRGLKRVMKRRHSALDEYETESIDWGHAETLAFASIISEGTPVRITGEDAERGTFSHRHAVVKDVNTGWSYIPLHKLSTSQATFECRNSALSENAAVGFEYGYALKQPESMVLWEAQFGDFVNGAQAVIDEFITSGRAKWGHNAPLIMLLPHGYEGQGPDHSTARLSRFLNLAADRNMRIVNPTTASQYFHLLRRHQQHLSTIPRPLIVMSPKSLLRHPMARSSLKQLSEGYFMPVIDDPKVSPQRRRHIKRVALCSGKIYVEAVTHAARPEKSDTAFIRIEQLYRFPLKEVKELLEKYTGAEEIVWLQEEPKNGGAYYYAKPLLESILGDRELRYIGRPHRASPAEGSLTWHKQQQDAIIEQAYAPVGS